MGSQAWRAMHCGHLFVGACAQYLALLINARGTEVSVTCVMPQVNQETSMLERSSEESLFESWYLR